MNPSRVLGSFGRLGVLLALALGAGPLWADERIVDPQQMPGPLRDVRFDQQLGAELPKNAEFRDETGRAVQLGDYFGERPVVLAFVYYNCPMLCSLVLGGLAKSVGVLPFVAGQDFEVVIISFNPAETPAQAQEAKTRTLSTRFGRPESALGWHFLSGSAEAIQRVTSSAGFRYAYLPESGEFAHAGGILVATPAGQIAQYFYGVEYPSKDLRLALVEASAQKIGTLVDQVLLYCYRYDPKLGKYTALTLRIMRLAGLAFVLVLSTFLWLMWRRERVRPAVVQPGPTPKPGAA